MSVGAARVGVAAAAPASPAHARRALAVLGAALVLGELADLLLRVDAWGAGFALWVAALLLATLRVARERDGADVTAARRLALPALVFAAAFAWRDAGFLLAVNLLALLSVLAVLHVAAVGAPSLQTGRIGELVAAAFRAAWDTLFGAFSLLLVDVRLRPLGGARPAAASRAALAVGRGVLLAVPALLVFGALFAAADAQFERLVDRLFSFRLDFDALVPHLAAIGLAAWLVGGFLRGAALETRPSARAGAASARPIGAVEMTTALALLDALFLTFVVVQLGYLFGGAAHVRATAALTVAEYARRGFFELVLVGALALPTLLAARALVRTESARQERTFRALAAALVLLVLVVMASAVLRMRLYIAAFGLSDDRIYATAFMCWLAGVFVCFAAGPLRGRARGFPLAALVIGWLTVAGLDALDPEALVVRRNAARAAAGRPFDAEYASTLGDDAIPALLAALPYAPPAARCVATVRLRERLARAEAGWASDWRAWNLGRARAVAALRRSAGELRDGFPGIQSPRTCVQQQAPAAPPPAAH